jgi:hypothetical protein
MGKYVKESNSMRTDRAANRQPQTSTLAVMKAAPDLNEEIRHRAYDLYEQRGREDGHDLDDWLRAESEMTRVKAKAVNA